MKYDKKTFIIVGISVFCFILLGTTIYSSVKSYKSGRLCNQLRERIIDAEDTNTKLAGTVEQCQSVCTELEQSVGRNITTAREAIELIEEIRTQVGNLQTITGDFDWDKYYEYYDNLYMVLE